MQKNIQSSRLALLVAALWMVLFSPVAVQAQEIPDGQARAVDATVLGTRTVFAGTGPLTASTDARFDSLSAGSIPSTLTSEVLHAATVSGLDQVDSTASVADLAVDVEGITVSAEFVRAQARATSGGIHNGFSELEGLSINGLPALVTGEINQVVPLVGGEVIINEQQSTVDGLKVNALHIIIYGVADLVIGSATAGF